MIKAKLSKHIYRDCKTHELGCWIHKYIKLPYPPFIGLAVHDGKGDIMKIKLALYDCSDKITSCFVGTEDHDDYEYAKQCALEFGWKVTEVPKGHVGIEDLTNLFFGTYGTKDLS